MEQRPADFVFRFFAYFIDSVLIFLFISLPIYLITKSEEGLLLMQIISSLYVIVLPVIWKGYLLGKRLMGIRVVKTNGQKVTIGTMVIRYIGGSFLYLISFGILLIISIFMVILRQDNRAFHDLLAGTIVINRT
ncbi:RDD family protein [Cytobacillus sp. IB215665]|uniref:RDD family protein n=1 Tax=Cytobacillus sp. IB215665 TaxID=3097357 RepID=UPI002A0AE0BA|nr:RDD family protein [Cytobacillus sp. IB215665]MDX8366573.1 RDD family protein [Cytobacillus sp. IB215665]